MSTAAFIWADRLAGYRFTPEHPLNPRRLQLTVELLQRLDLIGGADAPVVVPRYPDAGEIEAVHDVAYIEAVRTASADPVPRAGYAAFGLGSEDVPVVPGMDDAARLVCGATLPAAEWVMSGRVTRAFSISGGLHHARRAEAAGFCIYNDLAIAIRWLQRHYGCRVLYIDVDAHHGDGVQWLCYDDPSVLTVSLHESGAFLFPGTGFIDELGDGDGYGYSVNVPLDAHTEDASFLECFGALVPDLAAHFRPDVILLQAGCDAHALDPLTHLRCTTRLYERITRATCELADRHCAGRLIVTGGGGYAAYTVVPRAWTLVWAALRGLEIADEIPADWCRSVRLESGLDIPHVLRDPPDAHTPAPRRQEIEANNRRTVNAVRQQVLPLLTGWGLAF
ncbi:MAG: acetoin utilization protein AcuC [Gemmatimonadetes bacterium]|nr:acetoin utilization protein AcuC [Gemmatimonadota bacterium]